MDTPSLTAHPHLNAQRAPLDNVSNGTSECLSPRGVKVQAAHAGVTDGGYDNPLEPHLPPTASELKARALRMFTNRPNGVIGSGDGAVPVDATYELVLCTPSRRCTSSGISAVQTSAAVQRAQTFKWTRRRVLATSSATFCVGCFFLVRLVPSASARRQARHEGEGRAGEREGEGKSAAQQGASSGR